MTWTAPQRWARRYHEGVREESDPLGLVGQTLRGAWEVLRLAHVGALAHVYEARRDSDGMRAAVKCYAGLAELPRATQNNLRDVFVRVGREVARLARAYEGLVQPLGGGWMELDGGVEIPCIILEWLEGNTLEALMDAEGGGFLRSPAEVLELMADPLEVLAAAHQLGLVHRDIKPSNFYVCGDEIAPGIGIRILDLNLAKLAGSTERSVPQPAVLFMTPHYAAPEQFRGDDPLIGPWTDVFGVALVLVELMAGFGPAMQGDSFDELLAASENRERRPTPRSLGLDVPNPVEAVFRRALAVDVGERFRDAGAFLRALHGAVAAEGRVTSSRISRVSGVLDFEPGEDAVAPLVMPTPSQGTGTVVAPAPEASPPRKTGDTVIAERPSDRPAVTGYTVLSPLPPEDREND